MKKILNVIFDIIGFLWSFLPQFFRIHLITSILIIESRNKNIKNGLANVFLIEDKLNWILNERSMVYGEGAHPKHRFTKYFQYFSSKILNGEIVLDIGCSRGEVAREIALLKPKCSVVGIDIDKDKIRDAKNLSNPENLLFICADATKLYPPKIADVLIISNVLEHIEKRELFLSNLIEQTKAKKILLRVPLFERSWTMCLRKELGVNYFSDDDHKIEHKLCEFMTETNNAGIDISEYQTLWGEIWAVGQVR